MAIINGNGANNALVGTDASDLINGFGGDDFLSGLGGNDILDGGIGADLMVGGGGNDVYVVDQVGDVVAEGADGIDTVNSSITFSLNTPGRFQVENLNLTGAAALDGFGNALGNQINGNGANNTISGFDGNDVLRGFDGNDFLFGGSGNDVLDGNIGADTMDGGSGNDTYHVDQVGDVINEFGAADGTDTVVSTISTTLNVTGLAVENLTLVGGAVVGTGNGLGNTIVGNLLGNTLSGLAGDDRISGGAGGDLINGGIGNDTLNGQLGTDVLDGGGGNDTLNGGLDNDIIVTGSGNDTIVFNTPLGAGNVDSINDFSVANDTVRLDDAIFTGLPAGTLAADAFFVGPAAAAADDRIIYNDLNGNLFFDADGVGGAAQVQFANLASGLALTNNDFFVF